MSKHTDYSLSVKNSMVKKSFYKKRYHDNWDGVFQAPTGFFVVRVFDGKCHKIISQHTTEKEALKVYNKFNKDRIKKLNLNY